MSGGTTDAKGKFSVHQKANGYYLFSAKAMRRVYRAIVLKEIYLALQSNKLIIPDSQRLIINTLLTDLKQKEWILYAKRPFAGPEQVIAYLGRYTHRVAISNQRIKKMDEKEVSFWYKDYADEGKRKVMTLSKEEFLRRFVQHILPRRYMKIRSYGLFGNYRRKSRLMEIRLKNNFADPAQSETASLDRWLSRFFRSQQSRCRCCKTGTYQTIDIVFSGKHEDAISWRRGEGMNRL